MRSVIRKLVWVLAFVVLLGAGTWLWDHPSALPPWVKLWDWKRSEAGEWIYKLGIEQPSPGGKVVLDQVWLYQNKPDFLRVSGRFIGTNPFEKSNLWAHLREEPAGCEGGLSWVALVEPLKDRNETRFMLEFRNPPIAAPKLYLRIYGRPKWINQPELSSITDFSFSNPFRRTIPPRNAEPLPAVRKLDPLTVELTGLECGLAEFPKGPGFRASSSKLTARVLEKDQPSTHWRPMEIRYIAGNGSVFTNQGSIAPAYGNVTATTPGTLWKCEAPWGIQMILMRTNDFHADEILEVRDLPIPENGAAIDHEAKWDSLDGAVHFVGIAKGEVKHPGWENTHSRTPMVSLHLKIAGSNKLWVKLLSVADSTGKIIWTPQEEYRRSFNPNETVCFLLPERLELSEKLTCMFGIVRESREVDFVVNPTYVGTPYLPKVEPSPKADH